MKNFFLIFGLLLGNSACAMESLSVSTDLAKAVIEGRVVDGASLLEESLLDLYAPDEAGNTALHKAVFHGHAAIVKLLVEKIKLFESQKDYEAGIFSWGFKKLKGIVKKQPCEGLDKQNLEGQTSVHIAVLKGQAAILRYLLEQGADPNIPNTIELLPLDLAVTLKSVDCICSLIDTSGKSRYRLDGDYFKSYNASAEDRKRCFSAESLRKRQNELLKYAA